MEYLYAPWRSNYIRNNTPDEGCPLCLSSTDHDAQRYVLKRYKHVYVILNLYPYNPGHLMVIPLQHAGTLHELSPEVRAELIEVASQATVILEKELNSQGINMGLNIGGRAAGGTIPEHLHMHVLPRFNGDTNFLPILSQTKQISLNLNDLYLKLKQAFE